MPEVPIKVAVEYLYVNSQKTPVSMYNIVTSTKGIKQQRPDRINAIMDMLERNGYIKTVKATSNITYSADVAYLKT